MRELSPTAAGPELEAEESSEDTLAEGQLIDGRYRIIRRIGEGGMGAVYEARHEVLSTRLALKVLHAELAGHEEAIERLKREAQAASSIGNPHIVEVRDFGRLEDGSTYLAMELLEGEPLLSAIGRGPMSWRRAVAITAQVAEGLGAAHEVGIIHRDLKPENLHLVKRDEPGDFVKILDFGVAKLQNASLALTAMGRVIGTPEYMAPEQCAGQAIDHRVDIYSLGILLFEMLTGRLPFEETDLLELCRAQIHTPPPRPRELRPEREIPEALEAIVLRCLAKKKEARFQSMQEVVEALAEIEPSAGGRSAKEAPTADRSSLGYRATQPISPSLELAEAEPTARPARGTPTNPGTNPGTEPRRSPLLLAAALAVPLGLALGVWALWPSAGDEHDAQARAEATSPTETSPGGTESRNETESAEQTEPTGAESAPSVAEAPAPTVTEEIELRTDPPGALVLRGDEPLGRTPLAIDRPSEGDDVPLRVRAAGYREQDLVLSAWSAASLTLHLERDRPTPTRARRSSAAEAEESAAEPADEPPSAAAPVGTPSPGRPDFLDPWNR